DPNGLTIATIDNSSIDGRNLDFTMIAPLTGSYTTRLRGVDRTAGEYLLSVRGFTGDPGVFFAVDASIDEGALLTALDTITITFSEQVDLSSIDAGSLLLNGVESGLVDATIDGQTLVFALPPLADGDYTLEIPTGSLVDLQGVPIDGFSTDFRIDATGPRVQTSSIGAGGSIPTGGLTYTATFDEPLDQSVLDASDILLEGVNTGLAGPPTFFEYNAQTGQLDLGFVGLDEDNYTLTLVSGPTGFVDLAGNLLDGEPQGPFGFPSGDGQPGGDFATSFFADQQAELGAPFERLDPLGGLVAVSENLGFFGQAFDQDDFVYFLEAGETLNAVLTPESGIVSVSVVVPGETPAGISPEPGYSAVLPEFTAPEDGFYIVRATGNGVTGYALDVYRDLLVEVTLGDSSEDAAISIDDSFVPLGELSAYGRWAAVGATEAILDTQTDAVQQLIVNGDFEAGNFAGWEPSSMGSGDWLLNDGSISPPGPRGSLPPIGGSFDATSGQSGPSVNQLAQSFVVPEAVLAAELTWSDRINNFGSGFSEPNQEYRVLLLDAGGSVVQEVFSTEPGDPVTQTGPNERSADLTPMLQMFSGETLTLAFEQEDNLGFFNLAIDDVALEVTAGTIVPDVDAFEVTLTAGTPIDVVVAGHGGADYSTASLELLAPDGSVVATGTPTPLGTAAENYDLGLHDFTPQTGGMYTVQLAATINGAYGLVVTDGLLFDTEPNDLLDLSSGARRELTDERGALGFLHEAVAEPLTLSPALDSIAFGVYALPRDLEPHDHGHGHDDDDHDHDHLVMNSALTAFLPVGVSRSDLASQLKPSAASTPSAATPSSATPISTQFTSLIAVGETEDNDTIETADALPLGFDLDEDPAIDVSGTLTTPAPATRIFPGEDDGSIPLATPTGLQAGGAVIASATVGDGPFSLTTGDYDWYAIESVSAGQVITADIDAEIIGSTLDSVVAVYDSAGTLLFANDLADGTLDSRFSFIAPANDDYYLSVFGYFGGFQTDPFTSGTGVNVASTGFYDLTIGLDRGDTDLFAVELNAGDILGVGVTGGVRRVTLLDANGDELMSSSQDITFIHPAASPLPGGDAALSWVVDATGTYYVGVSDGAGAYDLDLRLHRPVLEQEPLGTSQTLFLDFDGATFDTSVFGGPGVRTLSPLDSFIAGWGLDPIADRDAVIDAIVASVEENLSTDIRATGINGDFDATGVGGQFDIEILNSRDHTDPFGEPNVSRVIVGGTTAELGIDTLGIAQSIDVGNFDTAETAVVLLDLLSAPASDPNSLNQFALDPSVSILDLIGVAVGNITTHEAGHFFGNWHTNQFNTPPSIMDQGGALGNTIGLVGSVWGDGDEIDVDFVADMFVPNEGFTGTENTAGVIAFGLSSGGFSPEDFGPTILTFDPPGGPINDLGITEITVTFSEAVLRDSVTDAAFVLIDEGPNGQMDGGRLDDMVVPVSASLDESGRTATLALPSALAPGGYTLFVGPSIEDLAGNPLNSITGPEGGEAASHEFDVFFEVAPGGDLYTVELAAGQLLTVLATTPGAGDGSPTNDLIPSLTLISPEGLPVETQDGFFMGNGTVLLNYEPDQSGVYSILVAAASGTGEYLLEVETSPLTIFPFGLESAAVEAAFGSSLGATVARPGETATTSMPRSVAALAATGPAAEADLVEAVLAEAELLEVEPAETDEAFAQIHAAAAEAMPPRRAEARLNRLRFADRVRSRVV
ncbi:MAG: Ig-like domain-containing protein, partial [Planctomycetota bacterium]